MISTELREIAAQLAATVPYIEGEPAYDVDAAIKRLRQLADEWEPTCEHKWRDVGDAWTWACRDCGASPDEATLAKLGPPMELVKLLERNGYPGAADEIANGKPVIEATAYIVGRAPYHDDAEGRTLQDAIDGLHERSTRG